MTTYLVWLVYQLANDHVVEVVYVLPLDALPLVLLLLQDEHGVVEELLQPLVGVVDAQLLKGVVLRREGRTYSGAVLTRGPD